MAPGHLPYPTLSWLSTVIALLKWGHDQPYQCRRMRTLLTSAGATFFRDLSILTTTLGLAADIDILNQIHESDSPSHYACHQTLLDPPA